jgi:hypothetical protein
MNKLKTIDIKGKEYVLVATRIKSFNENYPNGRITTELVSEINSQTIVIKATIVPDIKNIDRYFTGYSQAVIGKGLVNQTAALENAETSAVGRALAMLGIGIIDDVASADEMKKQASQPKQIDITATIKAIRETTDQKKLKMWLSECEKSNLYTEAQKKTIIRAIKEQIE